MAANVVLVHGADADGSSWSKVIPILQDAGHYAVAVQLPLTSIVDDAATARRAIDNLDAPVVVVGHSFGRAVADAPAEEKGLQGGVEVRFDVSICFLGSF
jgi:pimeloyl-ACP methyl ester carboxylesterase